MNTSSAKSKGRRLQQFVVSAILKCFPELTERDVQSTPMGSNGEDIRLSEAAAKLFPFSPEAKNQERLAIWEALEQAESNANGLTPIVVFKRNRSKTYVALEFDRFMEIIKK